MSASVSGSKTCTIAPAPHLSATALTNLMAIAPENLTLAQLKQLVDAVSRIGGSNAQTSTTTLGTLLT